MRLNRPASLPAPSFLQLLWLASPALPVGGFSYSEGLESAIENAGLAHEDAVGDWLLDQLHLTQARGDMACWPVPWRPGGGMTGPACGS